MSGVTVSVSLTKAQQGKLYMDNLKKSDRIKELRGYLIRIRDQTDDPHIKTIAEAALQPQGAK